jgi:hypothetical protein
LGADGNLLQGEISEQLEQEDKDVELLLLGFIQALLREQQESEL